MDAVVFESVRKIFFARPRLFKWLGVARGEPKFTLGDISLRVRAGSVLALLGPNGSGKTTLLKLISTMLLPDSGNVLVQGANTRSDARRVRACVGFAVAAERSFFPRLTARENLDFFAAMNDVHPKLRPGRIERTLARAGLLDTPDTLVMNFSAGTYQRLAIARALMKQPVVMLLDEPTRSLDSAATAGVWDLIGELSAEGTTVVIASHRFEEVSAVADSVLALRHGQVVAHQRIRGATTREIRSLYLDTTAAAISDSNRLVESYR